VKKLVAIPALLVSFALFTSIAVIAGCKQGEGERCQIDEDCESGLVCNQATQQCARSGTDNMPIDEMPPIDGPPVDAPPDAPPDMN
jgi:hypothetical protein